VEPLRITEASVGDCVAALRRSPEDRERTREAAADVIEMVRSGGDEAVRRLTLRLDGVDVPDARVPAELIDRAGEAVDPAVSAAIQLLAGNLRRTAAATMPQPTRVKLDQGQVIGTRPLPVDRVGIYVPGGLAAYPSSLVMAVVPAQVAGVPEIAVCSPPGKDGRPDRTVLAACAILGIREVYAIGGAQAVAALAIGTTSIPHVDVLVGPGNAYVEEAKRGLFGEVGIESLAGPSELVVLADASADPELIAWDLRAQAEHGAGALSVLVSAEESVLERVASRLEGASGVALALAESIDTPIAFVNAYAPEHVQLSVADPAPLLERIRHAGAVFVGELSGTAYGDYVAGSNHILPTGGRGRFSSGLGPSVFLRTQEVIEIPAGAAVSLAGPLAALARAEGFEAHARSAEIRAQLIRRRTESQIEQGAAS
jgi:histidinol dehydrogenase